MMSSHTDPCRRFLSYMKKITNNEIFCLFALFLGHFIPFRDIFFDVGSMGEIEKRFLFIENSKV